jgi:hypothetical protein
VSSIAELSAATTSDLQLPGIANTEGIIETDQKDFAF